MRNFEQVNQEFMKYNNNEVKMPIRATKHSVGYDFYSPLDIVIPAGKTQLIFSNVKAKFNQNEGLILASTSGLGKKGIILSNGIGIIECDYYGNESNDGNLGFMLHNLGDDDYQVKTGDKIGQGFFINFLTVENEEQITNVRKGGFGSTDK